jgi:Tfp pilus assembly protein PilX
MKSSDFFIYEYQRGQILLIVVLIMVTALTVGLSVAARSVTNTRTSTSSSNSEEAFSAAEAGIEQSLTSNSAVTGNFSNQAAYKTTLVTVAGTAFALNNGSPVLQDQPIDVWLSTYPSYATQWSGTMTIYWGQSSNSCTGTVPAALEILVLSGNPATPATLQLTRYSFDPCTTTRQPSNRLTAVTAGNYNVGGNSYIYSTPTITVNQGIVARVIPLYAPSNIGVQNSGGFPAQGTVIQSTGTSLDTQREVVTYRYYPSLPSELFQYNFFAP